MDLFGQNILDFPSADDTLFLGRLPRISESEYLQDLGLDSISGTSGTSKVIIDEEWSRDSAVWSEAAGSDVTDSISEIRSNIGSELGDEDSFLHSAVSFDQICRHDGTSRSVGSVGTPDSQQITRVEPESLVPSQTKTVESITFDDVIEEDISEVVSANEDVGVGLSLEDSGYHGSGLSQDGRGSEFSNTELLVGASMLITSNSVPDITDHFESSYSHVLPDISAPVPELHVPLSLDQMLSDSDDFSEAEDVLKTIDLNDVLQPSRAGKERTNSSFERLFDDFKNFSDNAEKPINIKEELHSFKADSEEMDYGLEQFDFNLCTPDLEKTDHPVKEEAEVTSQSHNIDDFLVSMFGDDASEDANDYDDLLNSILSEENINTDYFDEDDFDIDSVDPSCTSYTEAEKEIKTEVEDYCEPPQLLVNIKKEPEEEFSVDNFWLRDHDYCLPMTSSLFLTPPHSPGDDFEEKFIKKSLLVRKNLPNKGRSQIVKFNKPKDLKFVMTLPVKGGDKHKKVNARSVLKNKILHHNNPSGSKSLQKSKSRSQNSNSSSSQNKTAKELVREILEKRNLAQDIQEKKEFVRNMKKRMREETQRDLDREEFSIGTSRSKVARLEKEDLKKYRKFEEERELHNSMERQRRIEMKDAYDVLKATIPPIRDNEKVSKLNILNTARDYYLDLEEAVRKAAAAKQRELDRRRYLMERINLLKLQII